MRPDWRNILDVTIVSVLVYQLIRALAHTRANTVPKGVSSSSWSRGFRRFCSLTPSTGCFFRCSTLARLLLVILFQPEIRRGLDQLGRSRWRLLLGTAKDGKTSEKVAQEITAALVNLSGGAWARWW